VARAQGVTTNLLRALEAEPNAGDPLLTRLAAERREGLVRALAQIVLAARAITLLEKRRLRALPLKGAVLAGTVYEVEADRPMTDVDVLVLEGAEEALAALDGAGFAEIARGDHACAFADPASGGILELHWSLTSCPGLFPLDAEGLWARSRAGRAPLARLPSAEDLLVQLALHAAFQHGLVLSLVQWLDFRRLLERERLDLALVRRLAREAKAETSLGAALLVAEAVVAAPVPPELRDGMSLPHGLQRWLAPRLRDPLAFVHPSPPALARLRWELLAGRRTALLARTLDSRAPGAGATLPARLWRAVRRAATLAQRHLFRRRAASRPVAAVAGADACGETTLAEALLRDCLDSFDHVRLTVTGGCMQPSLHDGDTVLLVGPRRRRPLLGDVVLARLADGLRLPRLVWGPPLAFPRMRWRTKADRAALVDPGLAAADILGTVVAVEGRSGSVRDVPRALASLASAVWARQRRAA